MFKTFLRHVVAFLIVLNLIGGGAIPFAAFAHTGSAAGVQSAQPDFMGMDQADQKSAQSTPCNSMPCNSMPCKDAPWDCMQMCLTSCAPLGLANPAKVAATPIFHRALIYWPAEFAHTGLAIKPDPLPPKPLVS